MDNTLAEDSKDSLYFCNDIQDGAYIAKLLDLFDVSELDADKPVLHKLFDVFYAMREFFACILLVEYEAELMLLCNCV